MADPATVSSFLLDKYLVTVGRFRQFVNAWDGGSGLDGGAGYEPPPGSGRHTNTNGGQGLLNSGSDGGVAYETGWVATYNSNIAPTDANLVCDHSYVTWSTAGTFNENLPINCVNWYEAYAFCIWDAGFLPSQAELEYAAAGGSQQRKYPWGQTDPGTENQYSIYGCHFPAGLSDASLAMCTSLGNIAPVGTASSGPGLWGQLDLVGNVWELELDSYSSVFADPCLDCADLKETSDVSAQGGNFTLPVYGPQGRTLEGTLSREFTVGFRCARIP